MTIRDWINNPTDFNTGLDLYRRYGTRHHHIKMVESRGDTPANRADLIYELSKFVGQDESEAPASNEVVAWFPQIDPVPAPSLEVTPVVSIVSLSEFPPEVEALRKEAIDLKNEASFLHHKLFTHNYKSNEERGVDSLRVLELTDKAAENWDKIDYYKKHGKLPDVPIVEDKALPDDPFSLLKRRNTLRTYISSAKSGKHKRRKPEMIPGWEKEIEAIEEKLMEVSK